MKNQLSWQKTLIWVSLLSISMGFLESAVVVYLRKIYFPNGFDFPLVPMDTNIALTEILREAATLIMLLSIGFIAGINSLQRFAYFLYSFAVWDIFYYLFLKIILDWPATLLTWDILFLIPVCLTSPVIAPIIVSLTMITLSLSIIIREAKKLKVVVCRSAWILLIAGSLVIFLAFIWDFSGFLLHNYSLSQILNKVVSDSIIETAYNFLPTHFNWFLFIFGEVIIITGIGRMAVKSDVFKQLKIR